jgi:hypothetical protein
MLITWFHFRAEVSTKAQSEGAEAMEAEVAEAFDQQAHAQHDTSYAELKELVDDAVATVRAGFTSETTPAEAEAAIAAAAAEIFAAYPAPAPGPTDGGAS